jgi:hypothetical protein
MVHTVLICVIVYVTTLVTLPVGTMEWFRLGCILLLTHGSVLYIVFLGLCMTNTLKSFATLIHIIVTHPWSHVGLVRSRTLTLYTPLSRAQ